MKVSGVGGVAVAECGGHVRRAIFWPIPCVGDPSNEQIMIRELEVPTQ